MINSSRSNSSSGNDEALKTLELLNAVQNNSAVTQRSVAGELGIALGLANSYLKRCVKKGLIKIIQAPANRFAYYLTPSGFAEKSRLAADYFSISFDFYRRAKTHCIDIFAKCEKMSIEKIGLVGASDLAEIAVLCSNDFNLKLIGVIDRQFEGTIFSGLPVFDSLQGLDKVDGFVITDLSAPQEIFDWLHQETPEKPILAPQLLNISLSKIDGMTT